MRALLQLTWQGPPFCQACSWLKGRASSLGSACAACRMMWAAAATTASLQTRTVAATPVPWLAQLAGLVDPAAFSQFDCFLAEVQRYWDAQWACTFSTTGTGGRCSGWVA